MKPRFLNFVHTPFVHNRSCFAGRAPQASVSITSVGFGTFERKRDDLTHLIHPRLFGYTDPLDLRLLQSGNWAFRKTEIENASFCFILKYAFGKLHTGEPWN